MPNKNLVSIRELTKLYPRLSEAAVRSIIQRHKTSLKDGLVKKGHRLFIDLAKWDGWVAMHFEDSYSPYRTRTSKRINET